MAKASSLNAKERQALLETLAARFADNPARHPGLTWTKVLARLESTPVSLRSLHEMEQTGGEPDVVGRAAKSGALTFIDCSAESPNGRRSVCYDPAALASRKEHKPKSSAVGMATAMGAQLLDEAEYRKLQEFGEFDQKTSSWILTPDPIRRLGGALFCDRRYGVIFTYHNGAESYYAARGFRAKLEV